MARYRITLDRDACDGIFACLVRDDRFVEAADGLATVDDAATDSEAGTGTAGTATVVAEFDDDRLGDAEDAAAACPPGAIDVEVVK